MSLTWLHISDFHIRSGDSYDQDTVLGALVNSVGDYRERGRAADLIFATGDIAYSGKPEEYALADKFFDELLSAAGLEKNRLFVIPGNHDVDRGLAVGLARTLESREQADKYFAPNHPKQHIIQKLGAFLAWHNRYFDGIRVAPDKSTCGPVELVEVNGQRLGLLPINSALFCEDDNDHDKLWVGRRCLEAAINELEGLQVDRPADLTIALVHHPLDWLCSTEGSNIRAMLETSVDVLLRGHLHETRIESVASAEGELFHSAAGAAYQTRKWPNRALYVTFDDNRLSVYPIRYEDSPLPIWTIDSSVFPREPDHVKSFPIVRRAAQANEPRVTPTARKPAAAPLFRSNIPSRGNKPFVGREKLIEQIVETLGDPAAGERVVVLHGQPGVGKSELAREFARLHREHYRGGTFWVDASIGSIAIHLAAIGKNILDLEFPSDTSLDEQGQKTFHSLGGAPLLLIYDNVVSFDSIEPWLPLAGMPCHLLITTLNDSLNPAWNWIVVPPLLHQQSLDLVKELAGAEVAELYGEGIAARAGGLPVQIVPEATTLAYERRRGRDPAAGAGLAQAAEESFRAAYERLDQPARLLLRAAAILNPTRIPLGELSRPLRGGLSWSETDVERALDTCLDLHLLDGVPDPSMHQLFSGFLRDAPLSAEDREAVTRIRAAQKTRFVELAKAVSGNPADTQNATALISYPLNPEVWVRTGEAPSSDEGSSVGAGLYLIGRFQEAQLWLERAVAEKEKGDVRGRIDHESLGSSLHGVGYCLSSTGRHAEARPWFERAVGEKEKGDVHGRIHHASLGASLYQVGYCLSSTGQHAEARSWYERAVAEEEQGDVHGRIDHQSLGKSLHLVGYCLSSTGRHAEARSWYERAVGEKEQGDVHGRIDHESLGSSLHQVGYCLSSTGRFSEAQPWYERAVTAAEKGDVHGRMDHQSLGSGLHQVGYCLSRTGRYAEARHWYERAVAETEKGDVFGRIDHASLATTLRKAAECLRELGENEQAAEYEKRALEAERESGEAGSAG